MALGSAPNRRLAAILCADVAGYSRLMGADEDGTLAQLKAVRKDVLGPIIQRNGGRIVKTTGDGFLAEFASAVAAVRSAVEIQDDMARRGGSIAFRIGVNLGDIIHDGDDIFGDGVNVAARLEQLCPPGSTCVSRAVFDQVRDRLSLQHEYLGDQEVKNIARPVKVYRVHAGPDYRPLEPPRVHWARNVKWLAAAAVIILLAGVTAAALILPGQAPPAPERTLSQLSVAVLPFNNLSGDPAQDSFVDGITEDLITDLSRISGAFVISRNTSFTLKGKNADMRDVGRDLGVEFVLEGSVRQADGRVRINAQLTEVASGTHVWADRFDIAAQDVYALQDQITGRIARALNMELKEAVSRRAARGRPEDLDAAALATHAWAILFNKPQTPDTNEEARPILERAVALDPRNAEAWTGAAYMHVRAALYGWSPSRAESLKLALEAGERAIDLDPRSADAYYVLGFAVHVAGNFDRARRLFERCIDLNPNYAPAYFWLGAVETFDGRPELAPALIEKAFRLSPRDGLAAVWHYQAGVAYLLLGNDEAALRAARAGIAANPRYPNNYLLLAALLGHRGDRDEAHAALSRFFTFTQRPTIADLVRDQRPSEEIYRARFARYLDGLRKAGMPE